MPKAITHKYICIGYCTTKIVPFLWILVFKVLETLILIWKRHFEALFIWNLASYWLAWNSSNKLFWVLSSLVTKYN
jgi:hypothetical protein